MSNHGVGDGYRPGAGCHARGGYWGRYLDVDLTTGEVRAVEWPASWRQRFLGGSGVGAWLLWELLGERLPGSDPLEAECPLVFFTGPLTGSGLPGTARSVVCALSPLTGIWGEANAGGTLGPALKWAGWDGLVFRGRAESPCWLEIGPPADLGDAFALEVKIHSAADLWRVDTYEVCDRLLARAPRGAMAAVAAIGPAGERLVPTATIVHNRAHVFGRTGMGAVMGRKNLKAIAVWGTQRPPVTDTAALGEVRRRLLAKLGDHIVTQSLSFAGTASSIDLSSLTGDLPVRNWSRPTWEGAEAINATAYEAILTGKESCPGCPVGCKRKIRTTGRWPAAGPGPEYETLGALGSMLEIADLEAIAYANELCNRAGLDTISLGSTLALATECQERGWLQPEMVGGTRLSWGDATAMVEVVQQAAAGRGLGALVALGSRHLARTLAGTLTDPGARQELMEMAPHVKGLEIPMHDPRANHGMALAYATSYRGACHVSEINFFLEQGAAVFPGLGLEEVCVGTTSEGKARLLVAAQNMTGLACNCLLFCYFTLVPLDETDICAALQAVTGQAWSLPELMEAGERVWMLKRLLNTWRGVRKGDDRLPGRLLRPFDEGPVAGSAPDLDLMRDEFYRLRGLDEHGIPRAETLTRLGLPLSPTERDFGGESGRRLN